MHTCLEIYQCCACKFNELGTLLSHVCTILFCSYCYNVHVIATPFLLIFILPCRLLKRAHWIWLIIVILLILIFHLKYHCQNSLSWQYEYAQYAQYYWLYSLVNIQWHLITSLWNVQNICHFDGHVYLYNVTFNLVHPSIQKSVHVESVSYLL